MNSRTANRFRLAIRRADHPEAERVLDELRYEVETLWKAAASRQERKEIVTEITTLLDWAQQTVVTSRSHAQDKLVGLHRQKAYLVSGIRRREHVQVDG